MKLGKESAKNKDASAVKKAWRFIWEDNSIWSWILNIVLAFVLIKFVVYPGLGLLLDTSHPIVAVISTSMEHNSGFDEWWSSSEKNYGVMGISKSMFSTFSLKNGFDRGDIIILRGAEPENLKIGDIVVFTTKLPEPVIHRAVGKWEENGKTYFQTMGDNYDTNQKPLVRYENAYGSKVSEDTPGAIKIIDERKVAEDEIIGKAWFRIPFLGYAKILFAGLISSAR